MRRAALVHFLVQSLRPLIALLQFRQRLLRARSAARVIA